MLNRIPKLKNMMMMMMMTMITVKGLGRSDQDQLNSCNVVASPVEVPKIVELPAESQAFLTGEDLFPACVAGLGRCVSKK
jgi:hypothetical protein